ncbi:glycolate oxidase subunit GlcE [Azospirillum baldaniorum]|uniref:Glycolate oxidase, subunit GlcE n=1 Tax=Azospirillum baldaniorum TaxID=1064539 RepID=A0A9P1JPY0_9PROT|nr:glycolate oxidase subunit GlcE [Azospirillum baldaniorum]AWJ90352.1 glycolate oxidase subunit GlcE [Azospirillum baldaniorum]TWA75219.1 glycolate oxidase FAD binding subunit [Azospirillum brasilense]CCC97528.1 glycolate oxidase, subunit GlcE [Azospirillum baldaniorum]
MTVTTVKPDSAAQAADAVRWALSEGTPLDVAGSGSKRGLGRPIQTAYTLDLSGLSGVVAYEAEELVLTARAGTPMAEILPMLAERRQQFAFEPQDLGPLFGRPEGQGTLGGVISCGLAGPRRISAGSARDHTLGIEGVNGRGDLYKGGGKVVKNVTGYDVPKLMAGSFGTLTVLTELTVKVLPASEDVRTLLLAGREDAGAVAALTAALQSPYDVSGAAHLPAAVAARSHVRAVAAVGGAVTLVRVEGFGPSVIARVAALKEELGADAVLDRDESLAVWKEVRDVAYFGPTPSPASAGEGWGGGEDSRHIWKISVQPSEGPRVAESIRWALDAELYFDWGGGLIWAAVAPTPDAASAIRGALGTAGHATLVRAPEDVRTTTEVFHPLPDPVKALSRRVKESFDPCGILNPGRMYAGV